MEKENKKQINWEKKLLEYNFGEKEKEKYSGKDIQVYQSPKYIEAKKEAIKLIEEGKYNLTTADFWILMNTISNKTKMMYSGLIISHNGCLKINEKLEDKFKPECVSVKEDGYKNSLVFTYISPEQGIYEVGEVNEENLKNEYPYAMGFKRLFDRVVLKLSKIAFSNIYSDSEIPEQNFEEESDNNSISKTQTKIKELYNKLIEYLGTHENVYKKLGTNKEEFLKKFNDKNLSSSLLEQIELILKELENAE